MSDGRLGRSPGQPLRTAAIGGLAFAVLYLVHRIVQGTGLDSSTASAVAAYHLAHRGTLLASEVAVGISGGVFVAMGFLSTAAETALIGVADSNQPAAVLALNQLQGRTPVVWTITALVAVLSLAVHRTRLLGCWVGVAGLAAAAFFLLGAMFSVLGPTPEGNSSLIGVGLFVVWRLVLSVGLWRAASASTTSDRCSAP
jgi:hypothetical protein